MFQVIFWISLVIVLGGLAWHHLANPLPEKTKSTSKAVAHRRPWWNFWDQNLSLLGKLKRLSYLVALVCLALMALTSFVPRLIFGKPMGGYLLMLHVACAPVFIGCVAFGALTWSFRWRLNEEDWEGICSLFRCQIRQALQNPGMPCKLGLWLAILLAVPASLSMVFSMFPIFGTHGLENLFVLHQYTGLAVTLLAMIHVYFALRLPVVPGSLKSTKSKK
jgi:hypothetical protein